MKRVNMKLVFIAAMCIVFSGTASIAQPIIILTDALGCGKAGGGQETDADGKNSPMNNDYVHGDIFNPLSSLNSPDTWADWVDFLKNILPSGRFWRIIFYCNGCLRSSTVTVDVNDLPTSPPSGPWHDYVKSLLDDLGVPPWEIYIYCDMISKTQCPWCKYNTNPTHTIDRIIDVSSVTCLTDIYQGMDDVLGSSEFLDYPWPLPPKEWTIPGWGSGVTQPPDVWVLLHPVFMDKYGSAVPYTYDWGVPSSPKIPPGYIFTGSDFGKVRSYAYCYFHAYTSRPYSGSGPWTGGWDDTFYYYIVYRLYKYAYLETTPSGAIYISEVSLKGQISPGWYIHGGSARLTAPLTYKDVGGIEWTQDHWEDNGMVLSSGPMSSVDIYNMTSGHDITVHYKKVVPPEVISHGPVGTLSSKYDYIVVGFTEPMDTTTVKAAFSINPPAIGHFFWPPPVGEIMEYHPTGWAPETNYRVTIRQTATDVDGHNMICDFGWGFRTESFIEPPPLPPPCFDICASPSYQIVGSPTDYTVSVSSMEGFDLPVYLSIEGDLPEGAEWQFDPNPITPPTNESAQSILTILVPEATEPAKYDFQIWGTCQELQLAEYTFCALITIPPATPPQVSSIVATPMLASTSSPTPPFLSSTLANSGFENWTEGTPDSWTIAQEYLAIHQESPGHSGDFYARLGGDRNVLQYGYDKQSWINQVLFVTPGESYEFSFWARGSNAWDPWALYGIIKWSDWNLDEPMREDWFACGPSAVPDWTYFGPFIVKCPDSACVANIVFEKNSWGHGDVDDVAFASVEPRHEDQVIVRWEADMSKAIANKGFAPGQTLQVRSGYFGTAYAVRTKVMTRQGFTYIYAATDTITTTIGEYLNYQYCKVVDDIDCPESYYNFYYAGTTTGEAELRVQDPVASANIVIEDKLDSETEIHRMPVFRNTAVIAQNLVVTFTCDLRPAICNVADGDTLFDIRGDLDITDPDQVQTLGVAMNGPATEYGWSNGGGYSEWGAHLMTLDYKRMWDDGTHGDAVAGDTIWTRVEHFYVDSGDVVGQEFKFGIGGGDNESGKGCYGNTHIMNLDDSQDSLTVAVQFGSINPPYYSPWNFDTHKCDYGTVGDPNNDGAINILDVLAVVNHILGLQPLMGDAFCRGDCNGDGKINVLDALGIVNVILGVNPNCPGGGAKVDIYPETIEFLNTLKPYFSPQDFVSFMAMVKQVGVPMQFELGQNYPNPFNPTTAISYQLSALSGQNPAHITLKIYNLLGQEVATLVDEVKEPGYYTVKWDASGMASGVYFYRLKAGEFSETRRMVLMK